MTFFNNSAVVFNTGTAGATTVTPAPAAAVGAGDIMTFLPPPSFDMMAVLGC